MAGTALFVVDVQHELARDPETQVPHAARIRDAGSAILGKAREAIGGGGGSSSSSSSLRTIIFVQHHEDPTTGSLIKGSKAWELVLEPLTDRGERVIEKTTGDTFESNPNLAAELRALQVDRIVVFGIQSECCVLSTCLGAIKAGLGVTLLQGAHSTYDSGSRSAEQIERDVEEQLSSKGADIVPWEMWQF